MIVDGSIDVFTILRRWDVLPPLAITPAARGTNNLTWRVDTAGGSFVLRIYQNVGSLDHVSFEHALLRALSARRLSFAVPVPLHSRAGDDAVPVALGHQISLASLVLLIPGHHPDERDLKQTELSGAALGELDDALQRVNLPSGLPEFASYAETRRVHRLVPDPCAAVEDLALDRERRRAFQRYLAEIEDQVGSLYPTLPRQIIHSDMGRSSVLLEGERVTGLLDFEFASPDARAMDFAVGLYQFAADRAGFGIAVERVTAYARGYARWVQLETREVEAVPLLWRLRQAVSVIHRLGRWRQGVAGEHEVTARIENALLLDRWLRQHGQELIQRVMRATERTENQSG